MESSNNFFVLTQVLNNVQTVFDQLLEKSTTELFGSAEIQQSSSSRIFQVLDNFAKAYVSIFANQTNSTFDLKNLLNTIALMLQKSEQQNLDGTPNCKCWIQSLRKFTKL